jgi:hypothetical protein
MNGENDSVGRGERREREKGGRKVSGWVRREEKEIEGAELLDLGRPLFH